MRVVILLLLVSFCQFATAQDKKYTFVFLNKNPDTDVITKEESAKIMEGHMANINKLASEGKLLAAGPFEGGGGIFIFGTTSQTDVESWLADDPGVKAKRWNIEMFLFQPRIGSVCPVKDPYEMVMYNFVRYDAVVTKQNATNYPQLMREHEVYLTKLPVQDTIISEGVLGQGETGMLVLKNEIALQTLENDPAVKDGLLSIVMKKLYIAKGSFCEN
jgi:uncharacterized protein YciI